MMNNFYFADMMHDEWYEFGWHPISMFLFWGAIIFFLIYIFNNLYFIRNRNDSESALDILGKRYARGEITKKEFIRMKKDLTTKE